MPALPKPLPPPPRAAGTVRSAHDSHVRLRTQALPFPRAADIEFLDAQEMLDELAEDHLTMSMTLAGLEESVEQAPRDPSARAALATLKARTGDLGALRDALASLHAAMVDRRLQRMVVPDSPFADYLRGIYAWAHAVLSALDQLAESMRTLQPDWARLRWRIEEAKNFHFDELHEAVRADLLALTIVTHGGSFGANPPPVDQLTRAVEHLFVTATELEQRLDLRFG